MKKIIATLLLLTASTTASAIIIAPPIVYMASLSIMALLVKVFLAFAFWLALTGILSKKLFGKTIYELVDWMLRLGLAPSICLIANIALIFIYPPQTKTQILTLSAASTAVISLLWVLFSARKIFNSPNPFSYLGKLSLRFLAILIILYLASSSSLYIEAVVLNA